MGPRRPGRTHLQGSGASGPGSALQVKDLPLKAWADSLPVRIPGPSSCSSPVVPVSWGQGGRPVPSCRPLMPCTSGRGGEAQRGWKACLSLSAQPPPPPPCTDRGPRGQTGCGPWGAALPLGVPMAVDSQKGVAPPWTRLRCLQAGLRRHLSPDGEFVEDLWKEVRD